MPGNACEAQGALFKVAAQQFLANDALREEVFGPSSLLVECRDIQELSRVILGIEDQLTATLHIEPGDHAAAAPLLATLERKAGRILVNGWPTGVEVSAAMVQGGPYPATSDSRATSAGSLAIERFLRPVSYQDIPTDLLPVELKDGQTQFRRLVDGAFVALQGRM